MLDSPATRPPRNPIRTWPLIVGILSFVAISVAIQTRSGRAVPWPLVALTSMAVVAAWVTFSLVRSNRPAKQFSLRALLAVATFVGIWFALLRVNHTAMQPVQTSWQRFHDVLMSTIEVGRATVGTETSLEVDRPSFDDYDLVEIVRVSESMKQRNCPVVILDLSNTRITDLGVKHLTKIESLRFCILDGTSVSDDCIEHFVDGFPNLKVVSFRRTDVTEDGLNELRQQRPGLTIEPKSYLDVSN